MALDSDVRVKSDQAGGLNRVFQYLVRIHCHCASQSVRWKNHRLQQMKIAKFCCKDRHIPHSKEISRLEAGCYPPLRTTRWPRVARLITSEIRVWRLA